LGGGGVLVRNPKIEDLGAAGAYNVPIGEPAGLGAPDGVIGVPVVVTIGPLELEALGLAEEAVELLGVLGRLLVTTNGFPLLPLAAGEVGTLGPLILLQKPRVASRLPSGGSSLRVTGLWDGCTSAKSVGNSGEEW
jgi:hypothetical protein